ncbi:glycosyltransferase family 1 protein [Conidiobolus coronatus NRRL 28638]|uniref:Glycosyltransferase family 1 protein n=1 Tax=Conidiobolus coronatus (strain ATCC 28846 / CBS 209.66 / NRRL 28638) TaxID=796925 RepID=A0A137NVZ8_CONC2|nr:glycosyltransferase family 1 protein [Conidiobolus coronatus NRRL 28638]|eukprot:KXN66851.1 glycosyltransferase family 1 protein [Conidiobolus coronatus NRRL 28638]
MKINLLLSLVIFASRLVCHVLVSNDEKPLHIGVSIAQATRSHIKYLLEILEGISKIGHRITYLSMDEMKKFGNGYNVSHYSLGDEKMTASEVDGGMEPFYRGDSMLKNMAGLIEDIGSFYKMSFRSYERFYREEKPDLMICDFVANSCIDSAAKQTIPMVIGYQSLMFATTSPYLTATGGLDPTTIENYSFLQRMKHAFIDPINQIITLYPVIDLLLKQKQLNGIPWTFAPPGSGNMGIGIANSYVGLENARNIPSHIHPIGPILSEDVSPLSPELQTFMDTHSKILYVAFGQW